MSYHMHTVWHVLPHLLPLLFLLLLQAHRLNLALSLSLCTPPNHRALAQLFVWQECLGYVFTHCSSIASSGNHI